MKTNKTSANQNQTKQTFGFKWSKRGTYESKAMKKKAKTWMYERYCDNDQKKIDNWLSGGRKTLLDAGCGSGFSGMLFFGDYLRKHDYIGIDISEAVNLAKERFREKGYIGTFIQADIVNAPIPDKSVDIIFSEGVLHHTDSTEKTLKNLTKKLKKNGRFLFYIYAKKAIIREYTDDYIRNKLSTLTDEKAWEELKSLTQLGIELGKIKGTVTLKHDVPLLGIKKGKYNLQRFIYWNICKMYFDKSLSFEEMHHINFDWFRPLNCHRHTPEEIKKWCKEAGLKIERMNVQEAGITVIAIKIK